MSYTTENNEIGSNLTGGQIQEILDHLLFNALQPIFLYTRYLDDAGPTILANIVKDKRRKISALPHPEAVNRLSKFIIQTNEDKEVAFRTLTHLKIERNIWSMYLQKFLTHHEGLIQILQNPLTPVTKKKYKKLCRRLDTTDPWGIFNHVADYFHQYQVFKNKILKQYIGLTHKYASTYAKSANRSISTKDMSQSLLVATTKAIDKYDSSKGALTSYIQYWLMNARSSSESSFLETNVAFDIPNSHRTKIARGEDAVHNFALSLSYDSDVLEGAEQPEDIEEQLEIEANTRKLLRIIKVGDIHGLFRLTNNIDEILNAEEIGLMAEDMEQCCAS